MDIKQVGDQLVVTKTVIQTRNISDIKSQIANLEMHKIQLIEEQQRYTDLIAENDKAIEELTNTFGKYIQVFDATAEEVSL